MTFIFLKDCVKKVFGEVKFQNYAKSIQRKCTQKCIDKGRHLKDQQHYWTRVFITEKKTILIKHAVRWDSYKMVMHELFLHDLT